jgi:hypothetical protein
VRLMLFAASPIRTSSPYCASAGLPDAHGLEAVYLIWGVFANPGSAAAGAEFVRLPVL